MSAHPQLKVVIIDDEPKARKLLQLLMEMHFPMVSIVATCDSYESGLDALKNLDLDIVFLDVGLGHLNAFDLLNELDQINFQIIFFSAFAEKAPNAFKYPVVDYILKPVTTEALSKGIERAIIKINEQKILDEYRQNKSYSVIEPKKKSSKKEEETYTDVVTIPLVKGRASIINVKEILRCESGGDLSTIYFADESLDKIITTKSLRECEHQLPDEQFFRTHKQHLINLQYVDKLHLRPNLQIELINGEKIQLARRRKQDFINNFRRFKSEKIE